MNTEKILDIIKSKIDLRMKNRAPGSYENERGYAVDGMYTGGRNDIPRGDNGWTQSFFTGTIAYMYFMTKEEKYIKYLEDSMPSYNNGLEKWNQFHCMTHDAGFLYCLYYLAMYEVSGNKDAYDVICRIAGDYAKRFIPKANVILGFGFPKDRIVNTIIEDMMNLSLLMWAYRQTNLPFYSGILEQHIDTVLDVMLRDDYTFIQSYIFDKETGKPVGERNYRGYGVDSVWARGYAWAIYGLINAVQCLGQKEKYMKAINGTVNKFISYLPQDGIPVWDFSCIGSEDAMVDTSAGAIFASAMYKMSNVIDCSMLSGEAKNAVSYADKIMDSIIEKYLGADGREVIIEGGQCADINSGCVWGDYFFTEAVMRKAYGKDCPDFWN